MIPVRLPSMSVVTITAARHSLLCVQFFANLYGIPVPAGESDPDIFITLEVLNGDTSVGLYCNPGWGQYADVNANYPQPGYAVWQSGATLCHLPKLEQEPTHALVQPLQPC